VEDALEGESVSNSDSRSLILNRIRAALNVQSQASRDGERQAEWEALSREYRRNGSLTGDGLIAFFDERLRHYRGTPFYSNGDVRSDLAAILSSRSRKRIAVPLGFPPEWLPNGFDFVWDSDLSYDALNACDGVVTTCTLGIALTGTVVLESVPGQGRRAVTLVPDYHLCILRRADVVELVPEAIAKLSPHRTAPITFFSGPSATVDIEMTRVGGVHGPRTLDVLLT
jgi:L-lactate dehydrogenase complex protein LldG